MWNLIRVCTAFKDQTIFMDRSTCADPESFVRGGPSFFLLADERMAFRWRADYGPRFNAGLVAL